MTGKEVQPVENAEGIEPADYVVEAPPLLPAEPEATEPAADWGNVTEEPIQPAAAPPEVPSGHEIPTESGLAEEAAGPLPEESPAPGPAAHTGAAPAGIGPPLPDPPAAPPATAAIALGLGVLAVAIIPWRALVRALGVLFSHVAADRALAQPTREKLLRFIQANPGASLPEIQAGLRLSRGNASYHLAVLQAHRFIRVANLGRHRHYFQFQAQKADACVQAAALRSPRRRTIAEHVLRNPGCTQSDISRALGLSPSRVNAHVATLATVGLLERVAKGRAVLLRPMYDVGAFGLGAPARSWPPC